MNEPPPTDTNSVYFVRSGNAYLPQPLAKGPWAPNTLSGPAISGLIATIFEQSVDLTGFSVARYVLDFHGKPPDMPLTAEVKEIRPGRQMQLHEVTLYSGDRIAARGSFLLARIAETPVTEPGMPYPQPDKAKMVTLPFNREGSSIRGIALPDMSRLPGQNIVWLHMGGNIVEAIPATPFTRAMLIADFGGAMGACVPMAEWTFANMDISVHFFRMPLGEWMLIDSHSVSSGNGIAGAMTVLADEHGIFARGFNTLFIGKRPG
ncbi:MAG: thioesterase family protein [Alphaproteobacteria bacterium]|nr:thioesterase family protein [Alphaproteobacteria bacterium]